MGGVTDSPLMLQAPVTRQVVVDAASLPAERGTESAGGGFWDDAHAAASEAAAVSVATRKLQK